MSSECGHTYYSWSLGADRREGLGARGSTVNFVAYNCKYSTEMIDIASGTIQTGLSAW